MPAKASLRIPRMPPRLSHRPLAHGLLLATLALAGPLGCTTPADFPIPKPTDPIEQSKAIDTYKRLRATLGQEKGVLAFYLTTFNDPRSLVVEVKDDPTYERLSAKYSGDIEGLKLRMSVRSDLAASDANLEEVKAMTLREAYVDRAWHWLRNFRARMRTWPGRLEAAFWRRLGGAWQEGPEPDAPVAPAPSPSA